MKHVTGLLLGFILLFFSYEHKTEGVTKESAEVLKVTPTDNRQQTRPIILLDH